MTQIKKQYLGIVTVIAAILMISAIGIGNTYANNQDFASTNPIITQGEAVQIAVDHLETDISNLVEVDVDKEDRVFLYSIDFII